MKIPIPIKKSYSGFKFPSTIVATPTITITEDNFNYVTISLSEFVLYAGRGKHEATSYFVTNYAGEILWERKYVEDLENLREITIPKDRFKNESFVIIKAQYHTDTNTESNYGKKILWITKNHFSTS